jgi:hypothetical protein
MSLNYRDWYLVELYSKVVRTLGVEKATTLTNEVGEHFDSLVEEFTERGMDKRTAEISTIERLGSPNIIAEKTYLQNKKYPHFTLSLMAMCLIFSIAFIQCDVPFGFFEQVERNSNLTIYLCFVAIVFGLISTRPIKFRWIISCVLIAYFLAVATSYSMIKVTINNHTSYHAVKLTYPNMVLEHRNNLAIETKAVSTWRSEVEKYKSQPKQTVDMINIEYIKFNNKTTIPGWNFNHRPVITATKMLVGNGSGFEKVLSKRIDQTHAIVCDRVWRIGIIRKALNTRVLIRALTISTITQLTSFNAMLFLGFTWLSSLVSRRYRLRSRKLHTY